VGKKFIKPLCFSTVKVTELHTSLFKHTPNILQKELMNRKKKNQSRVQPGLTKGGRTLVNVFIEGEISAL
jgi:hypothetical protein